MHPVKHFSNLKILHKMANILGDHRVHWKYDNKKVTTCTIENKNREVVATGVATLFHKDEFDKKLARQVTFKRAIENAKTTLPKEVRAAVWADYRSKISQPNNQ